ncbi:MAG TPA: cyclic nucleotide-binding domain-containing protein [Candidatus Limnocylindrales bacterium]|nr:cyclic nucleotide-binding domain-containing protein [Candidatus Limnocylindrales bacterium]
MSLARLPAPLAAVIAVLHNRSLRRVLLGFIGFSMAEWASWIAILVYAYGRGGVAETGLAALVQLVPSAIVAPLAASLGDHVRRDRALLLAYLVQAGTLSLTAAVLLLGAPGPLVYLAAASAAASFTLTRPIQAAILPSLSRAPAELTAANVASGTVETGSILVGPILAGVALELFGPGFVFAASAAVSVAGAALVAGVHPPDLAQRVAMPRAGGRRGLVAEAFGGFGLLLAEDRPRTVLGLLGAAAVLWGALDVLLVVLALDLLAMGEAGVGYLNAAIGAGGVLGAAASILLIGRRHLAAPFAAAIAIWALPILLIGVIPGVMAALLLIAVAGAGRIVMDVAGRTLLQRVAPDRALARVFGVLEGMQMASLALGSVLAPALMLLAGPRVAFFLAGAALILLLAVLWRPLRRIDSVGVARPRELALIRALPIFAPLGPLALEQLAANLVPVHAHAGSVVIRQGEQGDHFYIIVSGRVAVEVDGRLARTQGPGESFGEIALLRNVPRTATVQAVENTELLALGRSTFLEAVTGQPASHSIAEEVVRERLLPPPEEADASA